MNLDRLRRPEGRIIFFRLSFDLGLAMQAHLATVVPLVTNHRFLDWIRSKSKLWMDSRVDDLNGLSYEEQLEFVRAQILANVGGRGKGFPVYGAIAGSLEGHSVEELASLLQRMCEEAHVRVGSGVRKYGGVMAGRRWGTCQLAEIAFEVNEPGATRCSFRKGHPDVITVHIGNHLRSDQDPGKGALPVFLNFPFYLLHEYLSHSLAVWQEPLFVEGYLVWAARRISLKLTHDGLRDMLSEETFRESCRLTEHVGDWFDMTTDGRFLLFLLEWAADENHNSQESELRALKRLADLCVGQPMLAERIRGAFDAKTPRDIRASLTTLARESTGIPPAPPLDLRLRDPQTRTASGP